MYDTFPLDDAIHLPDGLTANGEYVQRIIYTPAQGNLAEGLTRLQEAALDIPVAVVSLDLGRIIRIVRAPLKPSELLEERLVPGKTAFLTAFSKVTDDRQEVRVIVVSRTEVKPALYPASRPDFKRPHREKPAPRPEREHRPLPVPTFDLGEPIGPTRHTQRRKGGKRRGRR